MNRRGFLSAIAAAFVADPERLLWAPGKKLISIPKPNPIVTTGWASPLLKPGDVFTIGASPIQYRINAIYDSQLDFHKVSFLLYYRPE